MTTYLNSFWNAGFWSALLISLIGVAFRLAALPFEPFLAVLAWLGVWLAILLATRSNLVAANMAVAAGFRPTLESPPKSSDEPTADVRNRETAVDYIRAGLARTLMLAP